MYQESLRSALHQAKDIMMSAVENDPAKAIMADVWLPHGFFEGADFIKYDATYMHLFEEARLAYIIGLINHDLGKLSGRYDPEAWRRNGAVMTIQMRKHHIPDGIQMLHIYGQEHNIDLHAGLFQMINDHQERPDGTGYFGKMGDQISSVGQVAGVLDSLVSMCEHRKYDEGRVVHTFDSAWKVLNAKRDKKYPGVILDNFYALHRDDPRIYEPGLLWIDVTSNPVLAEFGREFIVGIKNT